MATNTIPAEAPPSYSSATAAVGTGHPATTQTRLDLPDRNGIPIDRRRSMEDETRPLPLGWVRTFDMESGHQFFVDTTKEPPRSIWTHPYDDERYLDSLSREERERIQQEPTMFHRQPSEADMMAEHTDEEDQREHYESGLPPRPEKLSLGRKLKNKITGTTHSEREEVRQSRARAEKEAYQRHIAMRKAMMRAAETGQPQYIGQDKNGEDVYVQPPTQYDNSYYPGMVGGGSMLNPYSAGMYSAPSSRYMRPSGPYSRPRGYGYGGGYGMPLGLGLGGGLLGGVLIGDMMGGGMGMGGMGMGMGMGGF
ncbi:hypothetical protein ANO11243_071250 [Dothideomycetidae sp. 11243]|nr:hypothetical protein ANO11243_071250 [fungal sp. No.11243]